MNRINSKDIINKVADLCGDVNFNLPQDVINCISSYIKNDNSKIVMKYNNNGDIKYCVGALEPINESLIDDDVIKYTKLKTNKNALPELSIKSFQHFYSPS